eukprot:1194932-Prorocentrum_minimum.AAC.6
MNNLVLALPFQLLVITIVGLTASHISLHGGGDQPRDPIQTARQRKTARIDPTVRDATARIDPTVRDATARFDPTARDATARIDPTVRDATARIDPTVRDATARIDPTATRDRANHSQQSDQAVAQPFLHLTTSRTIH